MKNSKKQNKILKVIVLLTILLIILLIILKMSNKEKLDLTYRTAPNENMIYNPVYEKEEKKEIYPKKSYEFIMQYKKVGKLKLNDLYSEVYNLKENVKKVFEDTKKMSVTDLEKYYDENKEKLNLFINKERFIEFVNDIKFLNNENVQFSYAEFDIDSFENIIDSYVRCNLSLNYNDGENVINFSLKVAKNELNEKYIFTSN